MQPVGQARPEPPEQEPELTLNLPDRSCDCVAQPPARDRTFLDRGLEALVHGDHIEALQHFQRYRRLERDPLADWEARMAIAYLATLPDSPFYDPNEASRTVRELRAAFREDWEPDERVLMMQLSLESFRVMYRHVDDLEDANATLQEDLAKREEAIKRLRELTLGQRAGKQ